MPYFTVRGPVALPVGGGGFVVGPHTNAKGDNGGTSAAINTTGVTDIFIAVGYLVSAGEPTLSDSKGNSWQPLTLVNFSSVGLRLYYAAHTAIVGAGHTFTIAGTGSFSVATVATFTGGAAASPFDVQNGTGNFSSAPSAGSISPTAGNEVVIAATRENRVITSIDGPFSGNIIENADHGGTTGAMAYWIQTAATPANPTWTFSGADVLWAAVIASFKSS